ncbi:6796_t:CDS:2, partial [Acaulospora colombiana]
MAKPEHAKSTGYERKVRAYLDSQGMVKLGHAKLTGYERKCWTSGIKKSNQYDEIIQKHITERNALMEEQHNEILKNSMLRDQVVRTTLEEYLIRKRPAEEASPIITSPPNLRDRTNEPSGSAEEVITPLPDLRNSTPPPFYSSRVNSFDDHNEESAEVEDGSTEAPPSNDRYESDAGIAREGDNNPFIAQTGEDSTKDKWLTQDGYNISIDFRKFQAESIKKLEINPTLSYAKEIDTILCLSSIMYCNELKPEYVECSEKTWNGARPRSLIPKELPTVADLVIIEYSR